MSPPGAPPLRATTYQLTATIAATALPAPSHTAASRHLWMRASSASDPASPAADKAGVGSTGRRGSGQPLNITTGDPPAYLPLSGRAWHLRGAVGDASNAKREAPQRGFVGVRCPWRGVPRLERWSPVSESNVIKRGATQLVATDDWAEIDLVVEQFGFRTSSHWDCDMKSYVIHYIKDGDGSGLTAIDHYLMGRSHRPSAARPWRPVPRDRRRRRQSRRHMAGGPPSRAGDPAVRVIRRIGERGLASASSTAWPRPRATKTSTDCMFRDEGSGRSWRYPAAWPRRDLSNGRTIGDEEAVTKESSAHRCGPSRRRRDCGAGEQGCAIVGVGDRCDWRDHGANSQADC